MAELRRLTEAHPELANFEDQVFGDGLTGMASGADTPLSGSLGQQKLKLTFNNPSRDSPSTANGADFSLGE